ncbi:MAG: hypothetical protein ACREMY_22470 [bacterium]
MTDFDKLAAILLKDAAARQTLVDRLLGRSVWNGVVTTLLVPLSVSTLGLLIWSAWARGRPEYADVVVGGTLSAVFWLSVALVQVVRQLRALATILERSGTLSRFVADGAKLVEPQS